MARDFSNFGSEEFKDIPTPDFEIPGTTYREFVDKNGGDAIEPLSAEALKLQAKYVAHCGDTKHPLDILRGIAGHPATMPKDKIAACKAIMEYTMVKVPAKIEVEGSDSGPVKLSQEQLSTLTVAELDTLIKLLEKMGAK